MGVPLTLDKAAVSADGDIHAPRTPTPLREPAESTEPAEPAEPAEGRADQAPGPVPTPPAARLAALLDAVAERLPRWRLPLATYAVCQSIFVFWWAAFYPGLMNRDSITYVLHVTNDVWVDNHSVLYDSLVWLSLHATGDLGALTLVQTVAMSAALAYTVAAFRRLGVPGRWTAVAAVALPPVGSFMIFIWKDVPFSICAYLVVPTTAHLISLRAGPDWRSDRRVNWLIAALGLELLGVCLFRNNGFEPVLLASVGWVVLLPGVRARVAAAATAAIFAAFVLNFLVYPAVGIRRVPSLLALAPAYADIAVAYADRPSSFTTADQSLMARVAPLAQWKGTANCYDADKTTKIPGFVYRAGKRSHQLFSLWLRVLQRSPDLILSARICRGSIAWLVFPGAPSAHAFLYGSHIPADLFGAVKLKAVRDNPYRTDLATRPLSSPANTAAVFLRTATQVSQLEWLLWRGATWCYVSYLVAWAVARQRRNWALLALVAIVVGQQISVLVDIPTQAFRYMASPIFIGIMLLPLFFARKRSAA